MSSHSFSLPPHKRKGSVRSGSTGFRRESVASGLLVKIARTHCVNEKIASRKNGRERGQAHAAPRKFTEEEVRSLRARFNGRNLVSVAAEFGITKASCRNIIDGKNYAWII